MEMFTLVQILLAFRQENTFDTLKCHAVQYLNMNCQTALRMVHIGARAFCVDIIGTGSRTTKMTNYLMWYSWLLFRRISALFCHVKGMKETLNVERMKEEIG